MEFKKSKKTNPPSSEFLEALRALIPVPEVVYWDCTKCGCGGCFLAQQTGLQNLSRAVSEHHQDPAAVGCAGIFRIENPEQRTGRKG